MNGIVKIVSGVIIWGMIFVGRGGETEVWEEFE
jgi:hypothetical protein